MICVVGEEEEQASQEVSTGKRNRSNQFAKGEVRWALPAVSVVLVAPVAHIGTPPSSLRSAPMQWSAHLAASTHTRGDNPPKRKCWARYGSCRRANESWIEGPVSNQLV